MKFALKAWEWLNGKKTWIAFAGAFVTGGLLSTGLIDQGTHDALMQRVWGPLGLFGLGHRGLKRFRK